MFPDSSIYNVLNIDLSQKRSWVEQRSDLFNKYIGGTGVATKLLEENCPQSCGAFEPENPIIFSIGPLTGLFPLASKTVAMFRSPHTGNIGESHCGGRSAVAMRMAGYGAIVIKGASATPVYIAIHGDKVYFRNAASLWGMKSSFTVGRIIRENEPAAGQRSIMRIGRAGEKLVTYSCVTTESYRHFGRLGLGAVFGSKKLKAIAISGKRSIQVEDMKQYKQLYDTIYRSATTSSVMKKYHDLGTAENVLPLNHQGSLPTKNLQQGSLVGAELLSGEHIAKNYLGRRLACSHCPVACIHIAALREPDEDEPYFYKTSMISYDYEPIYALGSMLGISDSVGFLRLMDKVEEVGIDAMSAGVILAWATEALERGFISEKETMGIRLNWGDYQSYIMAVELIVKQPNKFYEAVARGVQYASSEYGGEEFALALGGNEMPGYHTGPAAHAGVLIGTRHSHLDNAGYSIDQKTHNQTSIQPLELAKALTKEECWRQVLSSLVVCFFARGIYQLDTVQEALSIAGHDLHTEDITDVGQEIYKLKYSLKTRFGFDFDKLKVPARICEVRTPVGIIDADYIYETIKEAKNSVQELNK